MRKLLKLKVIFVLWCTRMRVRIPPSPPNFKNRPQGRFFAFRQMQTPMPTREHKPRSGGSSTRSPPRFAKPWWQHQDCSYFQLTSPSYPALVIAQPDKRSPCHGAVQQGDCKAISLAQHSSPCECYSAPINCSAIGFHFEKLILK